MSTDTDIEGLVDALRQDGPTHRDAARMQARLAALGVVTGASLAQGAVASSLSGGKVAAGVATRWASLSLLPKIGVVAAVSATAFAGAVAVSHHAEAPPVARAVERSAASVRSATAVVKRDEPASAPRGDEAPTASPQATARESIIVTPRASRQDARGGAPTSSPKNVAADGARAPSSEVAAVAPQNEAATASFEQLAGGGNAAPSPSSTLPAETALIDAAFAALRTGDTATASALVAEHARKFPNGLLSRERERARERLSQAPSTAPLR